MSRDFLPLYFSWFDISVHLINRLKYFLFRKFWLLDVLYMTPIGVTGEPSSFLLKIVSFLKTVLICKRISSDCPYNSNQICLFWLRVVMYTVESVCILTKMYLMIMWIIYWYTFFFFFKFSNYIGKNKFGPGFGSELQKCSLRIHIKLFWSTSMICK